MLGKYTRCKAKVTRLIICQFLCGATEVLLPTNVILIHNNKQHACLASISGSRRPRRHLLFTSLCSPRIIPIALPLLWVVFQLPSISPKSWDDIPFLFPSTYQSSALQRKASVSVYGPTPPVCWPLFNRVPNTIPAQKLDIYKTIQTLKLPKGWQSCTNQSRSCHWLCTINYALVFKCTYPINWAYNVHTYMYVHTYVCICISTWAPSSTHGACTFYAVCVIEPICIYMTLYNALHIVLYWCSYNRQRYQLKKDNE